MLEIDEERQLDDFDYDYNLDENNEEEEENKINYTEFEGTIFLNESEIIKEREKMISEAKEILFLERDDTILVMIYYQWNYEKLDNWYENAEQNRINAGIELSKELTEQFKNEKVESNGNICLICEEENNNNNLFSLNCGHQFCDYCWSEYLKEKIKYPLNALQVKCPQQNCTCVVYEKFYSKFLKDENSLKILNKVIYKNFIDINPDIKQCPNKCCCFYIKSNIHSAREIKCLCGTSYCFKCSREFHNPCPCKMIKKWLETNKEFYYISTEEEKSDKWIKANTKECPNCHQKIEKIDGCNYMLCNKNAGGCGNVFCYVCETEWSKHCQNHFQCNKYTEEVKEKEKIAQKLKEELEIELIEEEFLNLDNDTVNGKLDFYRDRYKNIQTSIDICKNSLKNILQEKTDILIAMHHLDTKDIQFIWDALECIINSKRILKNSYIFGYYMKDTQQKKSFENSLKKFESNIDILNKMLIDEQLNLIIEANSFGYNVLFSNYKKNAINLIDVINKNRETFVEDIENKYISDLDNELFDY